MIRLFTRLTIQGLEAAAVQGLAAGKIWIDGSQAKTTDGHAFVCSGFCLGRRHFITAVHYLLDASIEDRGDAIRNMKNPDSAAISISVARASIQGAKYKDGNMSNIHWHGTRANPSPDKTLRCAYLVDEAVDHDLAIFRIKDGEQEWKHTIEIDQLAPAIDHVWSHIFSVGYSSSCVGTELETCFDTFWQGIPGSLQGHQDQTVLMSFEELKAKVS